MHMALRVTITTIMVDPESGMSSACARRISSQQAMNLLSQWNSDDDTDKESTEDSEYSQDESKSCSTASGKSDVSDPDSDDDVGHDAHPPKCRRGQGTGPTAATTEEKWKDDRYFRAKLFKHL